MSFGAPPVREFVEAGMELVGNPNRLQKLAAGAWEHGVRKLYGAVVEAGGPTVFKLGLQAANKTASAYSKALWSGLNHARVGASFGTNVDTASPDVMGPDPYSRVYGAAKGYYDYLFPEKKGVGKPHRTLAPRRGAVSSSSSGAMSGSYRRRTVAPRFAERKPKRRPVKRGRVGRSSYGSYPAGSTDLVAASNGTERLGGQFAGRWNSIPRSPPSNLKFYDATTGGYHFEDLGANALNLGGVVTPADALWDPLGIPTSGAQAFGYHQKGGLANTRVSQDIVVVGIEVKLVFISPATGIVTGGAPAAWALISAIDDYTPEVRFYIDRQCNGSQFTESDVYQRIDDKTALTIFPTGDQYQQLPNVGNEARFDHVGTVSTRFTYKLDDFFPSSGGLDFIANSRRHEATFILKDPFVVNYSAAEYGQGVGGVNERKSLNFNGMFIAPWDNGAVTALCTKTLGPTANNDQPGKLAILSRTIFYDA